jgi:hypothetical protein
MTPDSFRQLALAHPEACEQSHMGHPDFRVGGKIFASLCMEGWGMVKLTAEQQAQFMQADNKAFQPASGAWGRRGATIVFLKKANQSLVKEALGLAWRNTAPASLTGRSAAT